MTAMSSSYGDLSWWACFEVLLIQKAFCHVPTESGPALGLRGDRRGTMS